MSSSETTTHSQEASTTGTTNNNASATDTSSSVPKKSPFEDLPKSDRIRRQIEFYFSDANLRRDKFLKNKVQDDPQVR